MDETDIAPPNSQQIDVVQIFFLSGTHFICKWLFSPHIYARNITMETAMG
jgi:hypothetical protein